MTVALTGSGGVYVRAGHHFGGLADVLAIKGGTATARVLSGASYTTRAATILADAVTSPSISTLNDNIWTNVGAWQQAQGGLFQFVKTQVANDIIYQVNLDAGLTSTDFKSSMVELIRQMTAATASIQSSTVAIGSQTNIGTPTGNVVIITSIKNAFGQTQQMPFPETLRFSIQTDSQTGGTARSETILCRGQQSVGDTFSHLWPGGSGCNVSATLIDAQKNNSGTYLTNGSFENFTTANVPDNWSITTGVAGTNVFSAGAGYTLTNALKITGDGGGTLTALSQKFNTATSVTPSAGGTPATLLPSTQYAVQFWTKVSAVPSAGVLEVALVDGSGTILVDGQSVACSTTVTLSGETTAYASHASSFRTPAVMPTAVYLRVRTSTAIDSAKSVTIDDIAFAPMNLLYSGGPSFTAFAASTNPVIGDTWTSAVTNTMGQMAMWFERLYGMNGLGLVIPFNSSPTVADSLIL